MWIAFSLLVLVLVAGVFLWHLAGARMLRNVGSPEYSVIARTKRYEIRRYESFAIATVRACGTIEEAVGAAFPLLFSFSIGREVSFAKNPFLNHLGHEISFPIQTESDSVSQVLVPENLVFSVVPKRIVVAYRLPWSAFPKPLEREDLRLRRLLSSNGLSPVGDTELVFYAPPHASPLAFRAELLIEVEAAAG